MNFMAPTSDVGFKKLFGNEHNSNLTKNFLNSLLGRKEKDGNLIKTIRFIDSKNRLRTDQSKETFLDLHVIDEQGNH